MQLNAATIGAIKQKNAPKLPDGAQLPSQTKKYDDPLNKWPIRGLAYSNELGAALSEIAPKLGLLLWVPALLYFGADIYDKYRNDKASYNPDGKRGTKQAVFQLLASVLLPTGAVLVGQKTASQLGALRKNGLTLQEEENLSNFTLRFIERRNLNDYKNNKEQFKSEYFTSLDNKRDDAIRNKKLTNPFKKLFDKIATRFKSDDNSAIATFFQNHTTKTLEAKKRAKIHTLAESKIDKIFELEDSLSKNQQPKDFTDKMFTKFLKNRDILKNDPEFAKNHLEYATKDAIKGFEHSKIFKQKMLKTVGGFIALGLAIKPIDKFVEQVIIEKFVEPGLMMLDDHNFRSKLQN